jgi:drug/metabolite transporter superfamily protein YnfA
MQSIRQFFKNMTTNMGVVGDFLGFLWQRKLWWLIPMVTVLLLFGLLLIFASASGVGPFIYTLF